VRVVLDGAAGSLMAVPAVLPVAGASSPEMADCLPFLSLLLGMEHFCVRALAAAAQLTQSLRGGMVDQTAASIHKGEAI